MGIWEIKKRRKKGCLRTTGMKKKVNIDVVRPYLNPRN
jgi:hypothetical protein